jgi:hypothetical protein
MSFHIHEFSNLSSKSVLLTNPVALRDTHLLPVASSIKLEHPPLINVVKSFQVGGYYELLEKALNIYTLVNNWCFWDDGKTNQLYLLGEMTWDLKNVVFDKPVSQLGLRIEHSGTPTFYVIK